MSITQIVLFTHYTLLSRGRGTEDAESVVKRPLLERPVPAPVRHLHEGEFVAAARADEGVKAVLLPSPFPPLHRFHILPLFQLEARAGNVKVMSAAPRRIDAAVPDLPEMLVGDMPDEPGDEFLSREAGEDMLLGPLVLVLEGHVLAVVRLDPALGHGWPLGVPADVVRGEPGRRKRDPDMHVPFQLP